MHEPARRHGPALMLLDLAVIKPVPVEPETQAFFVLDTEVIARQRHASCPPPLHGDALGTFGANDGVGGAAPDKPCRRAIRHLRDDLDLFRPLEQPQRPQWRLTFYAGRPDGLRGCSSGRN